MVGYIGIIRNRLKNKDFSIIASNCNGGVICKDFGVRFNSPFVNLFVKADGFVKLCRNLREYLDVNFVFVKEVDSVYGNITYGIFKRYKNIRCCPINLPAHQTAIGKCCQAAAEAEASRNHLRTICSGSCA